MSLTLFHMFSAWRPALTRFLGALAPPETEPPAYPFAPTDVARLHRLTAADPAAALDEQTWRDLLLERYADSLSGELGIVGRQELHRRLRAGASAAECARRRERVEGLLRAPQQLDGLHRTLRPLRRAEVEVAEVLFDPQWQAPPRPGWLRHARLLPLGLLASLAAVLLWSAWAWIPFGVVMYWLMTLQMRYSDRVGAWTRTTRALQMLLRAVALLDGSGQPLSGDFTGRGAQAGRLSRSLSRSIVAEAIPDAAGYGDWFALANVRHYFKTLEIVARERAFLRECYRLCAELEADAALARHLRGVSTWCWADQWRGPAGAARLWRAHPEKGGAGGGVAGEAARNAAAGCEIGVRAHYLSTSQRRLDE